MSQIKAESPVIKLDKFIAQPVILQLEKTKFIFRYPSMQELLIIEKENAKLTHPQNDQDFHFRHPLIKMFLILLKNPGFLWKRSRKLARLLARMPIEKLSDLWYETFLALGVISPETPKTQVQKTDQSSAG